ncbi:MAG: transcriptional repressor [Chloroflexi bacterium]|nr:transcriptional repressor [Chloroflexota bacterium]
MKGRAKRAKEASDVLRELGYRLTPQRMLILAAVQASDSHISAEEIYSQVRAQYPHVNISTVYRTLDLLKGLSLVTETDLGEGRVRYHYADKGHHHHLVCERCGAIIEVDEDLFLPLKRTLLKDYHFQANIRHFAIFGRCAKCPR